MIDSIVWELQFGQYEIQEENKLYSKRASGGKGFFNGSADTWEYSQRQHKNGRYSPLIKRAKRKSGKKEEKETLEIQISLPKIVHGTSLMEIDESDYDGINKVAVDYLQEVGVKTSISEIEQAVLKRVDFSKVVVLPTYLGKAHQAIIKLSQFNYKPSSDFNLNRYFDRENEGIGIKFLNGTQGYVIYDKISELIQRGYTDFERGLIEQFDKNQKRSAVKFELSIENKRSLESVVGKRLQGKLKPNLTLKDVLNRDLAKRILLDNFDRVFDNTTLGLLTLSEMRDNELLVYLEKSGLRPATQREVYYWAGMATKYGIKIVWEMIGEQYKGGSVGRIKKEISLAMAGLYQMGGNLPNLIGFFRQEHENFKIIRPQQKMQLSTIVK